MKESEIQKQIVEHLKWLKIPVYRMNVGTFQNAATGSWIHGAGERGTSDLCVGYPYQGFFLLAYIETKTKGGSLSDEQIYFLRKVNKMNSPWLVTSSVDDIDMWLKDRTYHGSERHTQAVLDESKKFIATPGVTKKSRLSTAELMRFNAWSDKYPQDKRS